MTLRTCALEKILYEGSIWTGPRAVIYFTLHKSIYLYFIHHGTNFYDKYIKSADRKIYIDDDGSGLLLN